MNSDMEKLIMGDEAGQEAPVVQGITSQPQMMPLQYQTQYSMDQTYGGQMMMAGVPPQGQVVYPANQAQFAITAQQQQQAMGGVFLHPPPQNARDWSSNLCDCCGDCKTCCCFLFCFCCLTASMTKKLQENCCMTCCCPMSFVPLRTKLRTLYGIKGSIMKDYCAYCMCFCCMVCQMDRELTHVGL